MIGPAQSRAARGLLDWSREELAKRASLDVSMIEAFEKGARALSATDATLVKRAFELARIEFTDGDEDGVRLKPEPIAIPVEQLTTENDK